MIFLAYERQGQHVLLLADMRCAVHEHGDVIIDGRSQSLPCPIYTDFAQPSLSVQSPSHQTLCLGTVDTSEVWRTSFHDDDCDEVQTGTCQSFFAELDRGIGTASRSPLTTTT